MTVEIVKDKIDVPDADNTTWVFHVRVARSSDRVEELRVPLDSYDLNGWVKSGLGRYPIGAGDKERRADIVANWSAIEPTLNERFSELLGRI